MHACVHACVQIKRELGQKEWVESDGEGTDVPPQVTFRKLSPYGFWVSRAVCVVVVGG